jgi:methylated-DNA-[protein]-cysteine S-methyltransferase
MTVRDFALISTPIGMVRVTGDDDHVTGVHIETGTAPEQTSERRAIRTAVTQLREYFAGERHDFDLPLVPIKTQRGQALRDGMAAIPYGESMSYGALARILESGPRAIGQACARNPYPIVIPCHRVLGSDGIGHYSGGGGLVTKQWLLDHELRHAGDQA